MQYTLFVGLDGRHYAVFTADATMVYNFPGQAPLQGGVPQLQCPQTNTTPPTVTLQ